MSRKRTVGAFATQKLNAQAIVIDGVQVAHAQLGDAVPTENSVVAAFTDVCGSR